MTQVFHIVGKPGAGKSTLIAALAAPFTSRGLWCVGVESPISSLSELIVPPGEVPDVAFLEHESLAGFEVQPGDRLVMLGHVPQIRGKAETHRAVLSRLEAFKKAPPLFEKVEQHETAALRADCGDIGHLLAESEFAFTNPTCVVCGWERTRARPLNPLD